MSSTTKCPHCGQRLPEMRVGIRLSLKKARIFDLIKRQPGINTRELVNRFDFKTRNAVRVHIAQINDILVQTDYRLRGTRGYGYRLEKVQ